VKKISESILLLIVLALCLTPVAEAKAVEPTRASDYLDFYSAYVYAEGGGLVSVWFDVTATGTMDEVGAITILLQESSNNSTWSTVKTFLYTDYPNMMKYNRIDCVSGVYYSGIAGRYYRAYVTVWAGKGGNGDSRQILTTSIRA
jgi:hypothetical protein